MPLQVQSTITGAAISNNNFRVDIDSNDNNHLSTLISFLGEGPAGGSLLASQSNPAFEGMAYFFYGDDALPPNNAFSAQQQGATENVTTLEAGRAVHRFRTTWSIDEMSGSTEYTVIADGRIVRDQRVTVADLAVPPGDLVSYVALDLARFDHVIDYPDGVRGAERRSFLPENDLADVATELGAPLCAIDETSRRLVGFVPSVVQFDESPGTNSVWLETDTYISLKQHFIVQPNGVEHRTRTMYMTAPAGDEAWCACVAAQGEVYNEPPSFVTLAGADLTRTSPGDIDLDGYDESGGWFNVNLEPDSTAFTFELSDPLPTMLMLVSGPPLGRASASIDGMPVPAARVIDQPVEGFGSFILLVQELRPGQAVTVSFEG